MELWLIQRAKIRGPVSPAERLSDAVQMDYMGSSEFEFGALPKSLRRLQQRQQELSVREVSTIQLDGKQLYVLSHFTGEQFVEYVELLSQLKENKLHLKERTEFSDYERKDPFATADIARSRSRRKGSTYVREYANFWWDIENDAMFTFDATFARQLTGHLQASFKYMDEVAAGRA